MRLVVHPGPGLVARFDNTVLLVLGDSGSPGAAALIEASRSGDGAADRLRAIGHDNARSRPAFFALVNNGNEVVSFIAGAMKVTIEMDGSRLEFKSTDDQGWMEENLRGSLRSVAVGDEAMRTGGQPLGDLLRGVVAGGGLELLEREGATSTQRAPGDGTLMMERPALSEAEAVAARAPGFDQKQTLAAIAALRPAPTGEEVMVEGRECTQGHLNDPLAPACRVCGSALTDNFGRGPRPPLGRLLCNDGASVVVDRDYIIGRKPEEAPEVVAGVCAALAVPQNEMGVSRVHCEIRISLWSVLLTDRNSANGTFIRPVGVSDWIRLEPGHTVQVVPGSGISVGPYELRYEA